MAAFAAASQRVRLGQMCTCMAYREPTYLAKVAATVDHVSGPSRDGHRRGLVRARVARVRVRLPQRGRASARARRGRADHGPHVADRVVGHVRGPALPGGRRPVLPAAAPAGRGRRRGRRAEHPLWIAGGGEKTLRIAAQHAQYTNFDGSPEGFAHKSAVLEQHCRDLGRDFGRSRGRPTTTSSSARPSRTSRTASPGSRSTPAGTSPRRRTTASRRGGTAPRRDAGADRRDPHGAARPGPRLRDRLLPLRRDRPRPARALPAPGHPGPPALTRDLPPLHPPPRANRWSWFVRSRDEPGSPARLAWIAWSTPTTGNAAPSVVHRSRRRGCGGGARPAVIASCTHAPPSPPSSSGSRPGSRDWSRPRRPVQQDCRGARSVGSSTGESGAAPR